VSQVQELLFQVQQRLQQAHGRKLTYRDLAQLAGTSERTMSEWMRGATSPMAMAGLLNLLARLPPEQATQVLARWQKPAPDALAGGATSGASNPITN
jgi:transcriptional regulator with XRE-family HTH domain